MPELYVAIPPLECLKMIVSIAMTCNPYSSTKKGLVAYDVSRAYFYAFAMRFVYVKIVGEDFEFGDGGACEKINAAMYGTRDAALKLHHHCNNHFGRIGSAHGKA